MRLLKPEYMMPIEANHFMLRAHANLAVKVGIPEDKIFVADNGQVVEFTKQLRGEAKGILTKEKVVTDYVMVDGLGVGDVSNIVLRDRQVMSEDGMIDRDKVFKAEALGQGQILSPVSGYRWIWTWEIVDDSVVDFVSISPFMSGDIGDKRLIEVQSGVTDSKTYIYATTNIVDNR